MSNWISMKNRLPESPAWVLVYASGAMNCMAYDGGWKDWTAAQAHNIAIDDITHWMPLPWPPAIDDTIPPPGITLNYSK
ncbi:MAG: hypothetical protein A2W25_11695 [candidate division Zixibacteria bacterium RBG_16_53_22]|nr:MAG: hypothetical protein A2W25_11695 [candidate division Zixibacteria bacterium RBG_16_53_22]